MENCTRDVTSSGYVDDDYVIAEGDDERKTVKKLRSVCQKTAVEKGA